MSWFSDVSAYILNHLEEYATEILKAENLEKAGKTIFVNSCPFCEHDNCFTLTKGVNSAHCFSCDEKGTLIQIVQKKYGELEGLEILSEWAKIKYNFATYQPEQAAIQEKKARFKRICEKAVEHYHMRLRSIKEVFPGDEKSGPGIYQVKVRKHNQYGLQKYQVGYSGGWKELKQSLLTDGFAEEDIRQAQSLIAFPEGYFVYPYYDKFGNLIRMNGKLFIRYCRGRDRIEGGYTYDCDVKYVDLGDHLRTTDRKSVV